jgi:hypothetical protein
MTDFVAALAFGGFVYGLLFWRSRPGIVLSGVSLAVATLIRPTFTYMPLLLPIVVNLVGRVTSKVPWSHVVTLAAFSLAATGASVAYQYRSYSYLGPSPVLILPIQESIYHGVLGGEASGTDYLSYKSQFEAEVGRRADRDFATLSPAERERYAKDIFRAEFAAHPMEIALNLLRNFVKYLFVPVESIVARVTSLFVGEHTYFTFVRPLLGVFCLPLWLSALAPPLGASRRHRMYYVLVLLLVVYVVGLSAVSTGSGERIRYPLLVFMLPLLVWNLHHAHEYLRTVSRWRLPGATKHVATGSGALHVNPSERY